MPDPVPDYLADPHHRRAGLRDLETAVRKGWIVPDRANENIPEWLTRLATDEMANDRERLRAAEIINAMKAANLRAFEVLDKVDRLDHGDSTENVATKITLSFDKGG